MATQITLVAEDKQAESAVRNGFALVQFLKPHFDRDKDGGGFVSFEMSLPLTDEHEDWAPQEILEAWEFAKDHDYGVKDVDLDNQSCQIMPSPDELTGKEGLKVSNVDIEKSTISIITEKGTGEERKIVRWHFRLRMELDNETCRFARVYFGKNVWLKLHKLQGKLIK